MKTSVVYTKSARKDLLDLPKNDAGKIVHKIAFYSEQKDPLHYAKKLKPPFGDLFRFKIGTYRAIFEVEKGGRVAILSILRIKHRKDMYR